MEPPTLQELTKLSDDYGFKLSQEQLKTLTAMSKESFKSMQWVNDAPEYLPPVNYTATNIYKPNEDENKFNAWYYKCTLAGDKCGLLLNKKLVIKDNICVAGVPLMNGSKVLEGFTPTVHATVVERVLDAAGLICGKGTCPDMCLSGSSHPSSCGPVLNPWNTKHSAGGSSAGCAVLVANGEVDMAIGGDQGGSIRIPASNCGIVGLKPTYGLVPYTGAIPIENSLDHLGPMAKNVRDCAILLQAIVGHDHHSDCRQGPYPFCAPDYIDALNDADNQQFKVAVLREGFELSQPEVNEICKKAIESMRGHFIAFDEVSVPMHKDGHSIWAAIGLPGVANQMIDGSGFGTGACGLLNTGISQAMHDGVKSKADQLNIVAKLCILVGKYTTTKYGMMNYAKGQGLALQLRREYDKIFKDYDVLIMPTLTKAPCLIPMVDVPMPDYIGPALDMLQNTCPFDYTQHPAITINAGFSADGLPIGLQIVGRHWQDDKVLAVASRMEHLLKPNQTRKLN